MAEEVTIQLIEQNKPVPAAVANVAVSAGVDTLSSVTSSTDSSVITKTVSTYREYVPKTKPGNHPAVKKAAKKAVKKTTKAAAKEVGGAVVEKTFWGWIKKGLQAIF